MEEFYKNPEFSRSLPISRETLLIKRPGEREYKRQGKLRLLLTIPELHQEFQLLYPDHPLSLSTFQRLRPKFCIPVGLGVYHNTCTCVMHENFDLMLLAFGNGSFTLHSGFYTM